MCLACWHAAWTRQSPKLSGATRGHPAVTWRRHSRPFDIARRRLQRWSNLFDDVFHAGRALVSELGLRLRRRRVMVTTADFGANYLVIGELATAAGLSSLSLVAGPIAYFAHEAAWHYYGRASARHGNPLEATVDVPFPSAAEGEENGQTRFGSVKVSRALAKTVTYESVTAVSEFGVNYLFVRDLAAAAGLTTFSMVIAPIVYYVHEKLGDYYDATKAGPPAAPAPKLLQLTKVAPVAG
jgi:uncharacterized membrane protein